MLPFSSAGPVALAGALALSVAATGCAGANKSKAAAAAPTQARTYAIGPIGPGLAAGDPGALTRWQDQMAADLRAGRPRTAARAGAGASRPAQAAVGPAAAAAERTVQLQGRNGGSPAAAAAPTGALGATGAALAGAPAAATPAAPRLSRATLTLPATRTAAAAEAVRGRSGVRWLWAVLAACAAALLFLIARVVLRRRSQADVPLAPGPARIERPRRTNHRPGPPPPRVTILASARR